MLVLINILRKVKVLFGVQNSVQLEVALSTRNLPSGELWLSKTIIVYQRIKSELA